MALSFDFIRGFAVIVLASLLFIVYDQALQNYINPAFMDTVPDSASEKGDILEEVNNWTSLWMYMPLLMFFLVILWMFVQSQIQSNTQFNQ